MTPAEYERIRKTRPELDLGRFLKLAPAVQQALLTLTPDQLIARRTARLLARQVPGKSDHGESLRDYVWDKV